jgi:hypothetical protein
MLQKPLKIKFQKDKKQVKVIVMPSNYEMEMELKTDYAVAYRKLIKQGVATKPAMLELMREEELWGEKEENKLTNLIVEAGLLEAALEKLVESKEDTTKEERKIVIKLSTVRGEIYELVRIKTEPLEYCAESIARDIQIDTYIALATKDEATLRPYFANKKQFLLGRDDADAQKIYNAVIEELCRDDIELIQKLPEHKWMVDNKIMDKAGNIKDEALLESLENLSKEE